MERSWKVPVPEGSEAAEDNEEETLQGAGTQDWQDPEADPWLVRDPWQQGSREDAKASEPRTYGPSATPRYEQGYPGWKPSHMEFSGPYPFVQSGKGSSTSSWGWQDMSPDDWSWIVQVAMSMKGIGKGKGVGMSSSPHERQAGRDEEKKGGRSEERKRSRKEQRDQGHEEKKPSQRRPQKEERRGEGSDRSGWGGEKSSKPSTPDDGDDPSDGPSGGTETEASSSVNTSELRSLVKHHMGARFDRPRASLGSVKIEEFFGDRTMDLKWKKAVQAQEVLYRLEEAELEYAGVSQHEEGRQRCSGPAADFRVYPSRGYTAAMEADGRGIW